MHFIAGLSGLRLFPSMLRGLTLPLTILTFLSIISGCGPATIALVHPASGNEVLCVHPRSVEESAALMKKLPLPSDFAAWGGLQAQYDAGRITLLEYCARRYELAAYVRSPGPSRSATYFNPTYRWAVTYPASWRLDDNDRRFVKIGQGTALLGIHTDTGITGKSLDEVADAGLRAWEQRIGKKFVSISRRRLTLSNDLPAIEIVHHIGTGVVGKSRKVIAIVKDRAFWMDAETYLESWQSFEGDFDRIIESFRVQE